MTSQKTTIIYSAPSLLLLKAFKLIQSRTCLKHLWFLFKQGNKAQKSEDKDKHWHLILMEESTGTEGEGEKNRKGREHHVQKSWK